MIELQTGDVFGTRNPMALGRAINFMQKLWSHDGESTYSHSGIIISPEGKTFEALWTLDSQNLFEEYKGCEVIIARPNVEQEKKEQAIKSLIAQYKGTKYPFWRLFLHTIPPFAKISLFKIPVCSELTALYLYKIGIRHGQWAGTNPDTLADEWRRWKGFDIVFEGKLS